MYKGKKSIEESEMYLIKDAYRVLEKMLDGKEWLVGDSYTLADISNVCSITTLEASYNIINILIFIIFFY